MKSLVIEFCWLDSITSTELPELALDLELEVAATVLLVLLLLLPHAASSMVAANTEQTATMRRWGFHRFISGCTFHSAKKVSRSNGHAPPGEAGGAGSVEPAHGAFN